MASIAADPLTDQTIAWRRRAQATLAGPPGDGRECLLAVREGVRLRRQWDQTDPEAPLRRGLLADLAAAQSDCQRRLVERVEAGEAPGPDLGESVLAEMAEDDRYLADLLADESRDPESVAFAIECFRDDLHWLGTQAAVLDGALGVDFLGRILLEQEAIQREIDAWEDASGGHTPAPLQRAAARLRATAVAQRIEALLAMPEPQDGRGWRRAWRAAGHLLMQAGPPDSPLAPRPAQDAGPEHRLDAGACQRLLDFRARAARGWAATTLAATDGGPPSPPAPPPQAGDGSPGHGPWGDRVSALQTVAQELGDAAADALTFLEDLPLDQAVRNLEILSQDAACWLEAARRPWDRRLRPAWRSMKRLRRRVESELQERRLARRLEGLFGRRAVVWWERLILVLLLLFVVMLGVEVAVVEDPSHDATEVHETIVALAWADLGICAVFLTDFLLRLALAQRRWLYFWRNWITGLLPSIPFGFVSLYAVHATAMAEAGEGFVLLRALRYLRLPRMARWLRIARPAMRLFRLVAFTIRASDRLVRQLAPLLNRNLVLFERAAIRTGEAPHRTALAALRERFGYRAAEVASSLEQGARLRLIQRRIDDLTAMLSAPFGGLVAPAAEHESETVREIPLDDVVARLLAATPASVSDRIGRRLARSVAQWCRAFDLVGLRSLPVVRDVVAASRLPNPYETTARVANRMGVFLKGVLDRVYWMADLHGTVTAPQLVDSIGEYMVKGATQPARRLILFGAMFLAVSYTAALLPYPALKLMALKLQQIIGTPLIVLGLLCLVPLFVGMWFRRIAGEATDFFTRVAEAQFLAATKQLKVRFARQQHAVLHRRVIAPEAAIDGDAAGAGDGRLAGPSEETDEARRAVELLWQDYLDGAPFHHSDTKTTTQLLGNLAIVALFQRLRFSRRRRKRLARLDLANSRPSLRGPYLWFRSVSRSLAQQTAKLVVDYNAHALPLARLLTADEASFARYLGWLSRRLGRPPDQLALAPEVAARAASAPPRWDGSGTQKRDLRAAGFQGNEFTAIHFLSDDRSLVEDVRRRYGGLVADLVRTDRRDNIRRVFRTYPLHRLPRERRTVNPMTLYQRHLAGGWVLVFPLKLAWWCFLFLLRCARLLWRTVRDVLHPTMGQAAGQRECDPYAVAERKIHRMRAPLYMECSRLRAEFDPEYLGVMLPGLAGGAAAGAAAPFEEDLARIGAEPGVVDEFRALADRRRRQVLELRRWLARFQIGAFGPRGMRAVAIAYSIDFRGVRSVLDAAHRLERAFRQACQEEAETAPGTRAGRSLSPRAAICRAQNRGRMARLFGQPGFRGYDARQQEICRRLVSARRGPLLAAVRRLADHAEPDPVQWSIHLLESVGRDPATWTRQLVTLRAVQTLSVLDLETYLGLTAELGEYEAAPARSLP